MMEGKVKYEDFREGSDERKGGFIGEIFKEKRRDFEQKGLGFEGI